MLPALRNTNISPGAVCVIRFGSIRESLQVMNIVLGDWPRKAARIDPAVLEHLRAKMMYPGDKLFEQALKQIDRITGEKDYMLAQMITANTAHENTLFIGPVVPGRGKSLR